MPTDREPEIFNPNIPLEGEELMENTPTDPSDVNGSLNEVLSATINKAPETNLKDATSDQKREYAYEKLKGKALEKLQATVLSSTDAQDKILNTLNIDAKIEEMVEKRLAAREAEVKKAEVLKSYSQGDADIENLIKDTLKNDIKESGNYEVDIQKAVNLLMSSTINNRENSNANSNISKSATSVTVPKVEDPAYNAPGLKSALQNNSSNTYSNY